MHTSLFDMLHDGTNKDILPITDSIDINLHCTLKEIINKDGMIRRYPNSLSHISLKIDLIIDDFHGTPAKNV